MPARAKIEKSEGEVEKAASEKNDALRNRK
jgi:hypothetical protein